MKNSRLSKLFEKEMSRKEFLGYLALGVGTVFGITGVIRELASRAATPTASSEAENGTVSSPATIITDSTASGGKAVKFGSGSTGGSSNVPYWGCAHIGNSIPTAIENAAGRSCGVHRSYWSSGQVSQAVTYCANDIAAKRVPWISFTLPDSWTQAAAGADDAWAKDICAKLGALNGPIMLTWHHEPEGDETPLTDWVKMHDRLSGFAKPYANIKCGPILTGYDWFVGNTYNVNTYWPGAFNSGDFLGVDTYCSYLAGQTGSYFTLGSKYFNQISAFAKSKGIEWGIGEFGLSAGGAAYNRSITGGNAKGTSGGDVSWLREAMSTATSLGGCLALSYFDSGLNSKNNVASTYTPSNLVGQPAWPLEDLTYNGKTYLADTGTPSKFDVFVDILKTSPTWRSTWP